MKQVVVLSASSASDLTAKLNETLRYGSNSEVADIKFSSAAYAFGGYVFSAMIIYEY